MAIAAPETLVGWGVLSFWLLSFISVVQYFQISIQNVICMCSPSDYFSSLLSSHVHVAMLTLFFMLLEEHIVVSRDTGIMAIITQQSSRKQLSEQPEARGTRDYQQAAEGTQSQLSTAGDVASGRS